MSELEMPNQSGSFSERHTDYLRRATEACERGDTVLGMHLYLAAYEKAVADPSIPDGMALSGLRKAWSLACELKERSMAEYVFEKLEPYLTGEEIAACAGKLQSLALDRLEEYGFSREELEDVAEMISNDFLGSDASVLKVESMSIPNVGVIGLSSIHATGSEEGPSDETPESAPDADLAAPMDQADDYQLEADGVEPEAADRDVQEPAADKKDRNERSLGMAVASPDFNPYDQYRDYSIGKSYHCATNEGSGAAVFTRDKERAAAHERYLASKEAEAAEQGSETGKGASADKAEPPAQHSPANADASGAVEAASTSEDTSAIVPSPGRSIDSSGEPASDIPSMPNVEPVDKNVFNYRSLAGYDAAVSTMRDFGIGLHRDKGFLNLLAMLNERHGLDRPPAMDTLLFRSPALEDAARFLEATIGELGLPALRMSMEESMQGVPVLCVMTQGDKRPRMNHAHNRFEAPAVLVIENLDTWFMPQVPEGVEGMAGFVMANISRGAREAVGLIRSAVEDPDVYVLASGTTEGEPDPFFYEVLEPMTIIDIDLPTDKERTAIWTEIARNHPSMRPVSVSDLARYSEGLSRYDIYMAARDAIEEAYKQGVVRRGFVPVSPQNIFEKIAECQPLESDEYRALEDAVVDCFKRDLDHIEDLIDPVQE